MAVAEQKKSSLNIGERLREQRADLTRSERLIADAILDNYPASALGGITEIAERANVSTPTVARLVQKLGFEKYTLFQEMVRSEVDIRLANSTLTKSPWSEMAGDADFLVEAVDTIVRNIRQSLDDLQPDNFHEMCDLLADTERKLFILGGRVSGALAEHLYESVQVNRANVAFINRSYANLHNSVLDMKKGDLLLIYDVRRYEKHVIEIAKLSLDRGVEIVLITDHWMSPISEFAKHVVRSRTAMPKGRDSLVFPMVLNELIVAQVCLKLGRAADDRLSDFNSMLDDTNFFSD